MDNEILKRKIQAFLHDPPEKAIILRRINHEERARELISKLLKDGFILDDVKKADHIASAADRINFPTDEKLTLDFVTNPLIIHPLSGENFDISRTGIRLVDYKKVMEFVNEAIEEIVSRYGDIEKTYLSLWREFQDIIKQKEYGNSALGHIWNILPSDTRVPDHSIWEHQRVTSAIVGTLPNPAMLLFAVGPVQDFIVTARKTQDLWAGSYMLSYLSWIAMKEICEEAGPDSIIFPDLLGQPFCDLWLRHKELQFLENPKTKTEKISSPTIPNRFLAFLPKEKAEGMAKKAEDSVKKVFKELCWTTKEKIEVKIGIKDMIWENIWKRQTEEFMEIYWTIVPTVIDYKAFITNLKSLMGDNALGKFAELLKEYETKGFQPNIGTVYAQYYKLIEKILGSRKTIRNFRQQEEPHYKCTMCGLREPVHPEKYNQQDCREFGTLRAFWREKIAKEFFQIKESERLCGVCLTKRFVAMHYFRDSKEFKIYTSYPSTSTVATAAFKLRAIEKMNNPKLKTKVFNYINAIEALLGENKAKISEALPMVERACRDDVAVKFSKVDGDWLYEDSFRESLKEELPHYSNDFLKITLSSLRELLKMAEELGIGVPSKYYAIIHMDGDNMGKWVSGTFAPEITKILHPEISDVLEENPDWQTLLQQKRPLTPSLHLATSKALRDFSLKIVREIVERDHLGKLIYAGGDDVLAFVNLKDLSDVMLKLRANFSGALIIKDGKITIDFKNGSGFIPVDRNERPLNVGKSEKDIKGFLYAMGTTATASMGVAIVHHSYDLSKALQKAREAEKIAKDKIGRNAFCISLNKRTGGAEVFGAKWFYNDGKDFFETIPILQGWIEAFGSEEGISPRFAYDFGFEALGLENLPDEALRKECIRLIERHRTKGFSKEKAEELVNGLVKFRENQISVEDVGRFLNITSFLGRRENR